MEKELGLDGKDEVGHVVRCTPTLRNVKESNAKSKAQLIVLQNGVSQLVITFRTSKAEYSDDKIRAAKIRFMLIFLPHLKGSTIDDFCSYYLEYLDYSKRGQTHGIDVLVAKQHAKLTTRQEKNPGLFRTPSGVHKFKGLVQTELMRQGHVPDWSNIDPPPLEDGGVSGASGAGTAVDSGSMSWMDDDDVAMQVARVPSAVSRDWGLASSSRSLEGLINNAIGAQANVSAGAGAGAGSGGGGGMSGGGGGRSPPLGPTARASPGHGGIPVSAPMGGGGGGGSVGRRSHADTSSAASVASSSSGVHVSELGRVKAAISAAKARTDEAAALVEDLERKLSLGNESEFPDVTGQSPTAAAASGAGATQTSTSAPMRQRNVYAEQALAQAQASRMRSEVGYAMAPRQPMSPTVAPTGHADPLLNRVGRSDYMRDCLDAIDMVAQQGDMLAEMEDPMYSYFNLQAGGGVMQQLGGSGSSSGRIGDMYSAASPASHHSRPV